MNFSEKFLTSAQGVQFTNQSVRSFRCTNLSIIFSAPHPGRVSPFRGCVTRKDTWQVNYFAFTQPLLILFQNSDSAGKFKEHVSTEYIFYNINSGADVSLTDHIANFFTKYVGENVRLGVCSPARYILRNQTWAGSLHVAVNIPLK
jgi:hypothetical protein